MQQVPDELREVRTKIAELKEEIEGFKAQIAAATAADPESRLLLQLQLIAPLQARLTTLRKKEKRLAEQQSVGEYAVACIECSAMVSAGSGRRWVGVQALVTAAWQVG